jgi:hypothetical protein
MEDHCKKIVKGWMDFRLNGVISEIAKLRKKHKEFSKATMRTIGCVKLLKRAEDQARRAKESHEFHDAIFLFDNAIRNVERAKACRINVSRRKFFPEWSEEE